MPLKDVPHTSIEKVREMYFENIKDSSQFIILIGANDGKIKDFLSHYLLSHKVSALLVEPIYGFFNRLKKKFGANKRLFLENCAIFRKNCKSNIYRIKSTASLRAWRCGLDSLNKHTVNVNSYHFAEIKNGIIKKQIKCITFRTLLKKYNVEEIHFLQIDVAELDLMSL